MGFLSQFIVYLWANPMCVVIVCQRKNKTMEFKQNHYYVLLLISIVFMLIVCNAEGKIYFLKFLYVNYLKI
jgi:hypothetical protein